MLCRWFQGWSKYTSHQDSSSGGKPPIDNGPLFASRDSSVLRLGLQEGRDYKLVGEAAWRALQEMHGGGPAIARPVIRSCVCSFSLGEQQIPVYNDGGFGQSLFGQNVTCKL